MDKKKLTRRVALGSIAGGLAGSALILRALRGRYRVNVPSHGYRSDWGDYVRLLETPINDIEPLTAVSIDFRPREDFKYRALSINAMYDSRQYPREYPAAPEMYVVTTGEIAGVSFFSNQRPALSIRAANQVMRGPDYCKDIERDGTCFVVSKPGDGVDYYAIQSGVPERIQAENVGAACDTLGSWLTFGWLYGEVVTKEMNCTVPSTSPYMVELAFGIVGFAKVAGRATVKCVAERRLDNQEVQAYLLSQGRQWKDPEDEIRKRVGKAAEEGRTETFHVVAYVDVETGVVLRHEFRKAMGVSGASYLERQVIITQAIQC